MLDVPAPAVDAPPLHRSVAGALASILECDAAAVPLPPASDPEPWTVWREWLAERGLGLVPVVDPAGFGWPGPWIALLRAHDGGGQVAAVAFGVPPGIAWRPLDGPEPFAAVEAGFLVAPADVALWRQAVTAAPRLRGRVEAIAVAPVREAPMVALAEAHARPGRGLEGDRYHDRAGTFSGSGGSGRDLTLIDAEALAAVSPRDGVVRGARRNVVTSGIDLNALVGRRFRVGEVECAGRRLCEPCAHLERLAGGGMLRPLVHRGGLRADVLSAGTIRVGDEIAAQ